MKTPPNRQAGLSLVELMISIAIGLFLLVGLVAVFANSNRTYIELDRSARQIENGRFAIQILSDDISLAGYYGRYVPVASAPGALPDPCETGNMASLRAAAIAFHVQGYDAPASSPITACLPAADHVAGTDILVVRRADSAVTASGSLVAQQVYIQANSDPNSSSNPIIALGNLANFALLNRDATTLAPIRKYHVHIYFVAPCSVPAGGATSCTGANDDNGAPIPTLKRLELTLDSSNNLDMVLVPLVEGIENFQVDYGIDTDDDGVPNGAYVTAPAAVTDWADVVALRVNVLARNTEASGGYTDPKTYDMGVAGNVTPGGAFKRHVYNAVIRLVNPSSRRES